MPRILFFFLLSAIQTLSVQQKKESNFFFLPFLLPQNFVRATFPTLHLAPNPESSKKTFQEFVLLSLAAFSLFFLSDHASLSLLALIKPLQPLHVPCAAPKKGFA